MRILSGIQPSGRLHIGNYFGALRQHIALQEDNQAFYFMASLHALTTVQTAAELRQLTIDVALDYLTLGLDPNKAVLFKQQDVPQVTELAWMLSCVCPMGLLERAHSYKDKVAQGLMANHGLFAYPVLMAADILIYHSDLVPVGQDQKQHIEITRDLASKFNNQFGDILKLPDAYILESTAVVPGVDGRKMSKSYGNEIGIFDEGKASEEEDHVDSDRLHARRRPQGSLRIHALPAAPSDGGPAGDTENGKTATVRAAWGTAM